MGKYYSVAGGNLYIYTTGRDSLLDLEFFPKELNLFETESTWRISPRIAVVENVLQKTTENAQIILHLNDYKQVNLLLQFLEQYFRDGDEYSLLEAIRETGDFQVVTPRSDTPS